MSIFSNINTQIINIKSLLNILLNIIEAFLYINIILLPNKSIPIQGQKGRFNQMNINNAGKIYISENSNSKIREYLTHKGFNLRLIAANEITYLAVCTHADILFCRMGAGQTAEIFEGDPCELGFNYPHNVKFNAVCLDRYFIHNLKYTSPALLERARSMGLELVNVKQGYTKCNTVVVDGSSIITADEGILRVVKNYSDIDALQIRQGFVELRGFEYGFLGGASGRVRDEIVFNGDLSAHPNFEEIRDFIEIRGLSVKYFPEYRLEDIGSIIAE